MSNIEQQENLPILRGIQIKKTKENDVTLLTKGKRTAKSPVQERRDRNKNRAETSPFWGMNETDTLNK